MATSVQTLAYGVCCILFNGGSRAIPNKLTLALTLVLKNVGSPNFHLWNKIKQLVARARSQLIIIQRFHSCKTLIMYTNLIVGVRRFRVNFLGSLYGRIVN